MNRLKVYWFGYGGTSHLAEELRPIINELGMELVTIHEWENADVKWNRHTYLEELKKADIIVLPTDYTKQDSKSNNRLTQSLALGKPVVCSPLPAYVKIAEQHDCALVAETIADWEIQLQLLRDNEHIRDELSKKALKVCSGYHIDSIGQQWLSVFEDAEKVDIIIPTYKNLPCLKMCIDSIRRCTRTLANIIVVNNGTDEEAHEYLQERGDIVYVKKTDLNFAQAINEGIRASTAKYVCFLNDDTIVSENWLSSMVKYARDDVGAVGPLSNCDKGWYHDIDIQIEGIDLLPGSNTRLEIEPIVESIYSYRSPHKDILERSWVAFYCTLIPRKVIEEVGLLDERFVNSGEDADYCYRIAKAGYKIVQCYESFVFHFGAVGRKILESENVAKYQESDKRTRTYLNEKWNKQNVVIYTGPSYERWDFRNLEHGGIGGSETWAVCLSRELSKNYRVVVFCDCAESGIKDGEVEYLHYSEYPQYIEMNWIDFFISSRTTDTLRFPIRSGMNLVMIHDIFVPGGREIANDDKVDKYLCLSRAHKQYVMEWHGIPEEKILITANGYNPHFSFGKKKKRYKCVYSSSPDRGLDNLLYMFPFIREKVPEIELHVFYGFDNLKKSIEISGDENKKKWLDELLETMEKTDGVVNRGRVDQATLSKEFGESSLLLYSCSFEETFCITALEAMRAGCVVLSSDYWGLKDTVGDAGVLIPIENAQEAYSKRYRQTFVDEAVRLLHDDVYFNSYLQKGLEQSSKYSWNNIAGVFDKFFQSRAWKTFF